MAEQAKRLIVVDLTGEVKASIQDSPERRMTPGEVLRSFRAIRLAYRRHIHDLQSQARKSVVKTAVQPSAAKPA